MECPHFAGEFMKYCAADRDVYVPSVYEMGEQCKFLLHKVCRRYMLSDGGSAARVTAMVCSDHARVPEQASQKNK